MERGHTMNVKKQLVSGILVFSFLTTSMGGVFAPAASAAVFDEEAVTTEESVHSGSTDSKKILTGLLAVGAIAAIAGGKDSDKKSSTSSAGSSGQSGSSSTGSSSSSGSTSSTSDEQQALNLLNQDRAKNGLTALKSNSQLLSLARSYAQDMINRGYFSHYNPEGQSPFDRMAAAGISYKTAGENLAINNSVAAAETAFMNSSGHRANILNSSYTEVGVGVVRAANGQVYVVQEFIGK